MGTIRDYLLRVKQTGAKKTATEVDGINTSLSRVNAQQDKNEKGTAAMGKNATANFAKMSQGLGGLVHVYATVN